MTSDFFFDTILKHYNSKSPFVVYRKPNDSVVKALLQTNDTMYKVSDFTETGFVFSSFNNEKSALLIPLEHSNLITTEYVIKDNIELNPSDFSDNIVEKQNHISIIQKGIDAIRDNQFTKVVLSRSEEVILRDYNPMPIFLFKGTQAILVSDNR